MTTTPTSGAADLPEALRSIQRFEVVDCIDDKHVPAVVPKLHGPWVRYEDHIAALAAGQATAAKAVVPSGWNLVPTEPTQAMLDAVVTSMDDFLLGKEAEKQYREDWAAMLAAAPAQPVAEQANADSVQEDAARLERERICAAIKAEDDYCVDNGDYMLDSDDCIKIVRGEWVRPAFSADAARKQGATT